MIKLIKNLVKMSFVFEKSEGKIWVNHQYLNDLPHCGQ